MIQLYVEKDTDLMRSTFIAIGLARFVESHLPESSRPSLRIQDRGSVYSIVANATDADLLQAVETHGLQQLLPAIKKKFSDGERKELDSNPDSEIQFKYVPKGFPSASIADYEAEQEQKAATSDKKSEKRQEGESHAMHPNFPLWAHLASYFGKASVMKSIYPSLIHTWYAHQGEQALHLVDLILKHYGTPSRDIEKATTWWEKRILSQIKYEQFKTAPMISSSSAVSPTGVQGSSRMAVANALNNEPLSTFWLEMYFAFLGYMVAGMPYRSKKDVLLYYPLPKDISFHHLRTQMEKYRKDGDVHKLYSQYSIERAKLDSLAYLSYYIEAISSLPTQNRLSSKNTLSGLVGYFYRDVGGTQAPFDEVIFAPPHWLALDKRENLQEAISILKQHKELISKIYGPKYELTSDELVVVNAYRNFITRGDSTAWVAFCIDYHSYAFAKSGEKYVEPLFKDLVEETLMAIQDKMDYRPILENQGFQAIANAIRSCTVIAQFKQNSPFRVRHGLGRDLMRRSHNAEHFIEDLTNFLYDYIHENGSVKDSFGEYRATIHADHISDIVLLVATYGSRVVASLLVAVGYAANYKKKEEN